MDPVFVPLADWMAEPCEFVTFAAAELDATEEEMTFMAREQRVVWLLDGWNEIGVGQIRIAESYPPT